MQIVFRKSIADERLGGFTEGRVITIDPAAPDFPIFKQWLKAGVVEAVRSGADPSQAPERAVAPAQSSRGRGLGRPSSASRRGRA